MSGISGYPSQEKLTNALVGYSEQGSKTTSQFVTVAETHDKHVVSDTRINGLFRTTAIVKTVTSVDTVYPLQIIRNTAHGALKGDVLRFEATATNPHFMAMVINVPDANTMILGATLPAAPIIGDEFFVLRHVVPLYDEDGTLSVSSGPIQFIRDAVATQVIEDTTNPANNIPLPVKLTSVTGDINITARDLNVQLSDTGANPDITRIGDGTNRLLMTVAGQATTFDATTHTALAGVNAELDSQTALLTTIDADTGSIATSASAINGKLPAALGQQTATASLGVVLASDQTLPLPTGAATEATTLQTVAEIQNLGSTLATQVTAAAILADTDIISNAVGVHASPSPSRLVMIGGESGGNAHRVNVNASGEVLTRNNGIPNTLGQATAANSTSVVIASDYAFPAVQGRSVVTTTRVDYTSTPVLTSAWTQLIASTASTINEIEIFDSSGQTLELGTGAAASETRLILVFPGGNGRVSVRIPAATRVSIRAVSGTANVGESSINYYA